MGMLHAVADGTGVEFGRLSAVYVGGADECGYLELLYKVDACVDFDEFLEFFEREDPLAAAEAEGAEVGEFQLGKEAQDLVGSYSGGIEHTGHRSGRHSGDDIGAVAGLLQRLEGTGVGESAGTSAAEGYAEVVDFLTLPEREDIGCGTAGECSVGQVALFCQVAGFCQVAHDVGVIA